ncbi:hypothetical protein HDA40_001971 [Hamadaea flava]|uniref:Uncharacterized protein n=1 Tax=Hamadaea flava TaxID=1742688 RepID=A0ABV8LYI7_9ACTN|nr:hypothetical protein [Hamadaea flava]MCP2323464.1 hypothetical protein [Hamadaea flava]
MRDAELTAHDAAPVTVGQRDGLLVLAAFGVCGMLAVRNAGRREHIDPMIVAKDAADSTVQVAVPMCEAKGQPVEVGGLTVVVARKVIGMTLEALREGWWDCTCKQPHRPDGGCVLQDRLEYDLATLGGWMNRDEAVWAQWPARCHPRRGATAARAAGWVEPLPSDACPNGRHRRSGTRSSLGGRPNRRCALRRFGPTTAERLSNSESRMGRLCTG